MHKKTSTASKGRFLGFWANKEESRTMEEYLNAQGPRAKIAPAMREAWLKYVEAWREQKKAEEPVEQI